MEPPRLGIVAGSGDFPIRIASACRSSGRDVFILALDGHANPTSFTGFSTASVRLGAAERALALLRQAGVSEITFAGKVRRPTLRSLRPDGRAARFLGRLALGSIGDDSLMRAITVELEREGFRVVSPANLLADTTIEIGPAGAQEPDKEAMADIVRGIEVAAALGRADAGQAVVVQQGIVLAIEADEGTDAMLARSGTLRRDGPGGVLVKISKPQQERRMDPPVIGLETVRQAAAAGLKGIAVEAGVTVVIDRKTVVAAIDQAGLFLIGIERSGP